MASSSLSSALFVLSVLAVESESEVAGVLCGTDGDCAKLRGAIERIVNAIRIVALASLGNRGMHSIFSFQCA
jgi:hypothetical protein